MTSLASPHGKISPSWLAALPEAVEQIRAWRLLAYPTETVFGLGADACSERAVGRLRRWKGRAQDQPLSVLVTGVEAAVALGVAVPELGFRLAAAFWPGPMTLVMRADSRLANGVARGDGSVGLRCSSHPVASALAAALERAGVGPVTATSLNLTGDPPARSYEAARGLCDPQRGGPSLLEGSGADAGGGVSSTVVDLTAAPPTVLRAGAIDAPLLESLLGESPSP